MRKFAVLSLFAMLFATEFAYGIVICTTVNGQIICVESYAGDFDPNNPDANGLSNENDGIVGGNPYGAATYQNFVTTGSVAVAGLSTNNLSQLTPTALYWEIRSGVSEGNGGTLLASGSATGNNFLQTPTGRSGFGYTEYTDVGLASVNLTAGTYWEAVVPVCTTCAGRSFNSNTFGLNQVGTNIPNQQFFNSSFFGANFTNANNEGVFQAFSSGVWTEVPEPSSMIMLGTGLLAAAGVVRRRLF